MKMLATSIAALTCLLTSSVLAAPLRLVVIANAGDGKEIHRALASWALDLEPGSKMMIFTGRDFRQIGEMTIPQDPNKSRGERKLEFVMTAMKAVKDFTEAMPATMPNGQAPLYPSAALDALAPIITNSETRDIRILIYGPPDFVAPGTLERNDLKTFPSDGLIVGDRSKSPFGTQGRNDLTGTSVDYCYIGKPGQFINDQHQERAQRAYALMIGQRGGKLTTFSSDTKSCFERFALKTAPEGKQFALDSNDIRMNYMYKPQDIKPPVANASIIKEPQTAAPPSASTMQAEADRFNRPARNTPPSKTSGLAWIGIQWRDQIDLDLYVRCSSTSPYLFFGNPRTVEGRHNFDYRSGTGQAFETVDLTSDCPDISKADVYVNFYSGSVPSSPKGLFAIEFDGGLYKADFEIPATGGNGGRGLTLVGQMSGPQWVKIDLLTVLKLRGQPQPVQTARRRR